MLMLDPATGTALVNPLLRTDSYKISHPDQYPPGTTELMTYVESRGGPHPGTIFFGLQIFAEQLAATRISHAMIAEARAFFRAHFGGADFFRADDWAYVVDRYEGRIPVEIRAVREGTFVPLGQVLATVRSTDPRLFWMTSFLETSLLRAIWYPTTVATRSNYCKALIHKSWVETSDAPETLVNSRLHDFGARGVSSGESAGIGGCAHLANFTGSDTLEAAAYAQAFYDEPVASFSIPAAEHSTITAFGREHELDAYANMLTHFAKPGAVLSIVSDSYDVVNAVDHLFGETLHDRIVTSGALVVIRPDSGDPTEVVPALMEIAARRFGTRVNAKGYRLLENVAFIQGDGMNEGTLNLLLNFKLKRAGFALDNIAFGMGGALLQQLDRDTYQFANKLCLAVVDGVPRHVAKKPKTDDGKRSKSGDLDLILEADAYRTIDRLDAAYADTVRYPSLLEPVYRNGHVLRRQQLAEIRRAIDDAIRTGTNAAAAGLRP